MAFSSSETRRYVVGDRVTIEGTYANTGGSAGGEIVTGLSRVEKCILQTTGVTASATSVNETLPLESGSVTVVTVANTGGTWEASGIE